MMNDDFDFNGFGEEPEDDEPQAPPRSRAGSRGESGGSGAPGGNGDYEEIDWEELGFEDLGYEPEDAERVRQAWHRVNARYRRDDMPPLARMIDLFSEFAGDAIPPETRRQLERTIRDLLVVIRDILDKAIERLDEESRDVEIEEIPID
jgi:hypothetical protein